MSSDLARMRQRLKEGDFRALFIEELGWDRHDSRLTAQLDGQSWALQACAQKRGMVAYLCPAPRGVRMPDYAARRKIERQVAKSVHEHLIVFTDSGKATQVWQWVRRESGRPIACREHHFHREQTGEALTQKLRAIAFTLAEEESLTLTDVTRRTRSGFDIERVTKRFYDQFKKEHATFLKLITGITEKADHQWYASVMLNRLMFVYFIQRKGFLDGDTDYLRNRLNRCQQQKGKDKFYSFYRHFLLRLFHEGLGGKTRTRGLDQLLGSIPYLNGGLFERHEIETRYPSIQMPDMAFERIFSYFDQYEWHLDERPLRADNEINPDVLGYIFEKYINQREMGAYYTEEDITEYISKCTIVPHVLDAALQGSDEQVLWTLLVEDPDRYIYQSLRHGTELALPERIAAGVDPATAHRGVRDCPARTVEVRDVWNEIAPPEFALPEESWREVVARRARYVAVRDRLLSGEVRGTNDLVTLNLDVRQFAQDVVESLVSSDSLRAFWSAIEGITILDPTCGSGAFLFAALNVLEPLYESCLDRMAVFVEDFDRLEKNKGADGFSDFRELLRRAAAHSNRRYFILKGIMLSNLFGVDIMEEAVEICKLRMFLKLASQVDPDAALDNLGIEPLPDIDFNIKCGNTLVGFADPDSVMQHSAGDLIREQEVKGIYGKAARLQEDFDAFREQQILVDGRPVSEDKWVLREHLESLEEELSGYLSGEYGVNCGKRDSYVDWRKSHQPFHWFVEFFDIIKRGGFDVVIGNPPYVEYRNVKRDYTVQGYATESCSNLYAFVVERNQALLSVSGRSGMIIPHSAICTDRMGPLTEFLTASMATWVSTYSIRPAKLFTGVDQRLAIYVQGPAQSRRVFSTTYHRWHERCRSHLFQLLQYTRADGMSYANSLPKVGVESERAVWDKIHKHRRLVESLTGQEPVRFHNAPRYWIRAMTFTPYFWNERDGERVSSHVKTLKAKTKQDAAVIAAVLSSSLFFWWFVLLSDCRDLVMREIESFPLGLERMSEACRSELIGLAGELMADLSKHKRRKETQYKATGKVVYDEFYVKHSKPIIDRIDCVLARHYGLTEDELDFVVNYQLKYRMGRDAQSEDE